MKRSLRLILMMACLLCLSVSPAWKSDQERLHEMPMVRVDSHLFTGYAVFPRNLGELEDASDFIFLGTAEPGAEQCTFVEPFDRSAYRNSVTFVTVTLKEVYKGDLSAGDTVLIGEPHYVWEEDGEEKLFYRENYLPSLPNRDYMFFVQARPQSSVHDYPPFYDPLIGSLGRYALVEEEWIDQMTSQELLCQGDNMLPGYTAIAKEIIVKYLE